MSKKIDEFGFKKIVMETYSIKYIKIDTNLNVFSANLTSTSNEKSRFHLINQGLIDDENLAKLKTNSIDVKTIQPPQETKDRRFRPFLITKRGVEIIRSYGHPYVINDSWEELKEQGDVYYFGDVDLVDMFANGMDRTNVYFLASYDHSFVDIDGKIPARAFRFDYLDASLSNEYFDLNKAADILFQNPEVSIMVDRHSKGAIQELPYHSSTDENNQQIVCKWVPSRASWANFLETIKDVKNEDGTPLSRLSPHDLLHKFDVLGLVKSGCLLKSNEKEIDTPKP